MATINMSESREELLTKNSVPVKAAPILVRLLSVLFLCGTIAVNYVIGVYGG